MGAYAGPANAWSNFTNQNRFDASTKLVNQSGLVLNLDAGVSSSYPGSGTTWTDLSGNGSTGTLSATSIGYDSSLGRGSLTFDGTDDYVAVTGSITTSAATFIVWVYRNGDQGNFNKGLLFGRQFPGINGLNYGPSNSIGYHWNDAANTYTWSSGLTIPNLIWCMCAISVGSSSAIAYLGQNTGITTATNSVSHSSTTITNINVGMQNGNYSKGNISQALIYNRALSATEIAQNFNATRARFGI